MHLRLAGLALVGLATSCSGATSGDALDALDGLDGPAPAFPAAAATVGAAAAMPGSQARPSAARSPAHTKIDGRDFPEKVIALTYDDGPDASTLDLAGYLKSRRISATFFVVGSWIEGLSDDPGHGKGVFQSGYEYLPVLGDLVELGHRVGNHTLNHVVLREAAGARTIAHELGDNQHNLDPFLTNELRLFRAPGGGWGSFAAGIVDGDPYLSRMVGPVAWDVDRKDWDESLQCRGPRSTLDCERAGPGGAVRMRASAVAARYVAAIESAGHGIVLLHDRVGHVGSSYGLELAQAMIPQLEARGFVFAAPVLRFSPPVLRRQSAELSDARRWDAATVRIGDVNGDGRDDVCGRGASGVSCAISVQTAPNGSERLPRTMFRDSRTAAGGASPGNGGRNGTTASPLGAIHLADVTGDGQADVCVGGSEGIACAASNVVGELGTFRTWSRDVEAASYQYADVDGDGRADACRPTAAGIACARNLGRRFDAPRTWLGDDGSGTATPSFPAGLPSFAAGLKLADVDGDGRADACARGPGGVFCALSSGTAFGAPERWSAAGEFGDADVQLGDLNGDRRDDVCGWTRDGVVCALSTGRGFTRSTVWSPSSNPGGPDLGPRFHLGDVNGDGRADLCAAVGEGVACALAP